MGTREVLASIGSPTPAAASPSSPADPVDAQPGTISFL